MIAAPSLLAPTTTSPRSVSILGATGSVGRSTVAVIEERPELFRVRAVTAGRDAVALAATARRLGAQLAVVADPAAYPALAEALAGSGIEAAAGAAALLEAAARPADWVMSAIVGFAGLAPTLAALRRGALVALANKESIVCAGPLMLAAAAAAGARILPVDSEHNAIFQALSSGAPLAGGGPVPLSVAHGGIERLVLTASGGPFRRRSAAEMAAMRVVDALAHPTWTMGAKISIDSATMMNKGLEIIEAHHLFGVPEQHIEVVVHPQSIVHSLVGFTDGSLLAQLGAADMRIPIAHTLGWPGRLALATPRLDLAAVARLDFEPPDPERFPALRLARAALRSGGAAPTLLNGSNEVAVGAFLAGRIGFLDIAGVVEDVLNQLTPTTPDSIDGLVAADAAARRAAEAAVSRAESAANSSKRPRA